MSHILDVTDKKILDILKQNARVPLKVIAEKVYLSVPTVSERILRLEKAKVITGYMAQVDPAKLGYTIQAFINLTVDPARKSMFFSFVSACPSVSECYCVTGEFSMLLKVAFRGTAEFEQLLGQLQQFGRTQTQIIFSVPVGNRGLPAGGDTAPAAAKD